MKTKITIIQGHPDSQSFCSALADAYAEGALAGQAEIRRIDLSRMEFDPVLRFGYRQRMELEDGLVAAQEDIRWADHLVFVYPNWWGAMPALLKGFIDRVFLPGFAFKYREKSALWDKLLVGRSARLIVTTDTPSWYNRLVYRESGLRIMKRNILHFNGIKPVRITQIGPVRPSAADKRKAWLEQAKQLGRRFG